MIDEKTQMPVVLPAMSDRERAVSVLTSHFAEGNLVLEEFERRVSAVYSASSLIEVNATLADLQVEAMLANVPERGKISAFLSNSERTGPMMIPRHLEVVSVLGNVELDMRSATFSSGITEIHVKAFMGNVEITLPANVQVEAGGDGILGNFESRSSMRSIPEGSSSRILVRITGRAILASVETHQSGGQLSDYDPHRLLADH